MKNGMRAIVVQRLGPPEVLELGEVPVPEPGPGQVLVQLHATGVNFSDTERRRGVYAGLELPWIPGRRGPDGSPRSARRLNQLCWIGAWPSGRCRRR